MDTQTAQLFGTLLGSQAVVAVAGSWLLQRLKAAPWFPFIDEWSTNALQRAWAAAIAVASSLSILYVVTGSAVEGWQVSLTIPPLLSLGKAAFHAAFSFAMQEIVYRLALKPKAA